MPAKSLREVADALVGYCRENNTAEGLKKLYHKDAVSVEATVMPGAESRETKGVKGIQGKHEWWDSSFDVHSANVDGPYLHGDDRFGVVFEIDVTGKNDGKRMQMKEIGVYTVDKGKIVREEFFYTS